MSMKEKEKTWVVTFSDHVKAETEEEAYVQLLEYLAMCVSLRDVTAFGFTESLDMAGFKRLFPLGCRVGVQDGEHRDE